MNFVMFIFGPIVPLATGIMAFVMAVSYGYGDMETTRTMLQRVYANTYGDANYELADDDGGSQAQVVHYGLRNLKSSAAGLLPKKVDDGP